MSILCWIYLVKIVNMQKINYILLHASLVLPFALLKEYNKCVEFFMWQGKWPLFNCYIIDISLFFKLAENNMAANTIPAMVHIEKKLIASFPVEACLMQLPWPVPDQNPVLDNVSPQFKITHVANK